MPKITLEKMRALRKKIQQEKARRTGKTGATPQHPSCATNKNALWKKCASLAGRRDILVDLNGELTKAGNAGDPRVAQLIYLIVNTRLLTKPVSLVVKGQSSAGKSHVVDLVLKYVCKEAYFRFTSMSPHRLAHAGDELKHRMVVLTEAAGIPDDTAEYFLRTLLSEGRIDHETLVAGKPKRLTAEGPIGLIQTTTADSLNFENETRMLSVTISDGPGLTKEIMRMQARAKGQPACAVPAEWPTLSAWLAINPPNVIIPYSESLSELIPPVAVRLRRDFPIVLSLIESHALLHQKSRTRDSKNRVVATFEDYEQVRRLVGYLISVGVETSVSTTVRRTVEAVAALGGSSRSVSVTQLAKKLGIVTSNASRRAVTAVKQGYLRKIEHGKGNSVDLRLDRPMPSDSPVLPTTKSLRAEFLKSAKRSRGTGNGA
jgi:hypothetical protein